LRFFEKASLLLSFLLFSPHGFIHAAFFYWQEKTPTRINATAGFALALIVFTSSQNLLLLVKIICIIRFIDFCKKKGSLVLCL
jgi:hypothetical protein